MLKAHLDTHEPMANVHNGFLLWHAPKLVSKVVAVKDNEMNSYLSLISTRDQARGVNLTEL